MSRRHDFQRRILDYLRTNDKPIAPEKLAEEFGQTRTVTTMTDEFRMDLWVLVDRGVVKFDDQMNAVLTDDYKKK